MQARAKQRHIFDFYATAGCGRAFMGEGVREKNSSSYGEIVMKAFEKFCRGMCGCCNLIREDSLQ